MAIGLLCSCVWKLGQASHLTHRAPPPSQNWDGSFFTDKYVEFCYKELQDPDYCTCMCHMQLLLGMPCLRRTESIYIQHLQARWPTHGKGWKCNGMPYSKTKWFHQHRGDLFPSHARLSHSFFSLKLISCSSCSQTLKTRIVACHIAGPLTITGLSFTK